MDYLLTEEQKMLKDMVAKFAKEELGPIAREYQEQGRLLWSIHWLIAVLLPYPAGAETRVSFFSLPLSSLSIKSVRKINVAV